MKPYISALLIAAWASAAWCGEPVAEATSVQVCGLRVARAAEGQEKVLWPKGTTISLQIVRSGGDLVRFDSGSSAITAFADEKGNDLQPKEESGGAGMRNGGAFSLFPRISEDRKTCLTEVSTSNLPAKGSGFIKLEGVIGLQCAKSQWEHLQNDVAIKNGAKITGPNLELSVDEVGKPDIGGEPLSFVLRSSRDLDDVAEIRFYKSDGKEIQSRRTGTQKMGILGSLTVLWSYALAEKVDAATVKVFFWNEIQRLKVPFSLKIDLGL